MPVPPATFWLVGLLATVSSATARQPSAIITSDDSVYRDCSDLPSNMSSGVYMLRPGLLPPDIPAYCDMDEDNGGWTVVIRRADIEPRENFLRDWDAYKWGIGIVDEEFYWGNEYMWKLTSHHDRRYKVHFWLEDWDGNTRHALYQNFLIESEAANYTLQIGEYSGDAGDNFYYNDNMPFSTHDRDNDAAASGNCALTYGGGWWYRGCTSCKLTGEYYDGGHSGGPQYGIVWHAWKDTEPYSLKSAVMKIKPSKKL